MWTIYSIGDSNYLFQIYNAVAAITATNGFAGMIKIGLLLGLFFIVIKGILSGGRELRLQDFLIAVVVFSTFFGPKTTVDIDDVYDGTVKTVANVPVGLAALHGTVSNVGRWVTETFETAFSTPSMTEYGFDGVLNGIQRLRKIASTRTTMQAITSPQPGMEAEQSLVNYISDCTLVGVDLGLKSMNGIDGVNTTNDFLEAIRWDSRMYTVLLYPGGDPQTQTCTDAWQALKNTIVPAYSQAFEKLVAAHFNIPGGSPVWPTLSDGLTKVAGATVDAQKMAFSFVLARLVEEGIVSKHEGDMKFTTAAMVQSAIDQHNTQWAAQTSLFETAIRPLMTFIEGLTIAVAPIMAFLIVLSPGAMSMGFKYLLLVIWIQLWMPVLAVINLFVNMSATGDMQAIQDTVISAGGATLPFESITASYQVYETVQHWLATGGMLASSVPAITLMLVYGGAVTATHLAGRMQGGDFVNEKVASPDVVQPSPFVSVAASNTSTLMEGTMTNGLSGILPSFSQAEVRSQNATSSERASQQSDVNFSQAMSSSVSSRFGDSVSSVFENSRNHNFGASSSSFDQAVLQRGKDLSMALTGSEGMANGLSSVISSAVGMGGKAGVSAQVSSALRENFNITDDSKLAMATSNIMNFANSKQTQRSLKEDLSSSDTVRTGNVFTSGMESSEREELARRSSDSLSRSRDYQEALSLQTSNSSTGQINVAAAANSIADNPAMLDELRDFVSTSGYSGAIEYQAHSLQSAGMADQDQAYAASALMVLTGYSHPQGFSA